MNGFIEAALQYAQRGWRVFPVYPPDGGRCACGRARCKPGKHPKVPNWPLRATTDKGTIQLWWDEEPFDNIAVATGRQSNLLVLDVDIKQHTDGRSSLAALQQAHAWTPNTFTVETGSGGLHLYFRNPDVTIRNSTNALGRGIDIRSDGGCVIAPPSIHASGGAYRLLRDPGQVELLPQTIVDQLKSASPRETGAQIQFVVGERNSGLASEAGKLRNAGMGRAEIFERLSRINFEECAEPLPLDEVWRVAESISQYPIRQHKSLQWIPFDMNEWFSSDAYRFGKDRECGWRANLLAQLFRNGGYLPDDEEQLRQVAKASPQGFRKCRQLVLKEFVSVIIDGKKLLAHPYYTEICEKQMKNYRQKCEASARGVAARNKRSER